MSKQQTAVDWLIENLVNTGLLVTRDYKNLVAYTKAKELEKKQIFNAWEDGKDTEYEYQINSIKKEFEDGVEYYNETFEQ